MSLPGKNREIRHVTRGNDSMLQCRSKLLSQLGSLGVDSDDAARERELKTRMFARPSRNIVKKMEERFRRPVAARPVRRHQASCFGMCGHPASLTSWTGSSMMRSAMSSNFSNCGGV